jgi:predicted ArsR family transcriptional regulator
VSKEKQKIEDSSERILSLIKTQGDMSVKSLAQQLQMTTMGVGQHLNKLLDKGLLKNYQQKQERGRPISLWKLTGQGHGQYTDRHANLTIDLINLVEESFGQQGLDKIIQARSDQSLAIYLSELSDLSLAEKVQRLAQIRSDEGYMATVITEQGSFTLIENHCPICAAASACQGFCKRELENFQACFEGVASVERSQHILEGDSRCCYKINPIIE